MSYLGCFGICRRVTLRTILKKLTGNPYSVSSIIVDRDGVEPPESEDNRFTVCPVPTYGISVHNFNLLFVAVTVASLMVHTARPRNF